MPEILRASLMRRALEQLATTSTARTFTFSCPLPPPELHQNARLHHFARNKATREYRQTVGLCVLEAGGLNFKLCFDRAVLSLEFVVPDRRRRDLLNYAAAFKAGIDALVDVGLILDDDAAHLEIGRLSMTVNKGAPPCVLVTLEAATA